MNARVTLISIVTIVIVLVFVLSRNQNGNGAKQTPEVEIGTLLVIPKREMRDLDKQFPASVAEAFIISSEADCKRRQCRLVAKNGAVLAVVFEDEKLDDLDGFVKQLEEFCVILQTDLVKRKNAELERKIREFQERPHPHRPK